MRTGYYKLQESMKLCDFLYLGLQLIMVLANHIVVLAMLELLGLT